MEELGSQISDLASALYRLSLAYRPQRRLVELRLIGNIFEGTGWRHIESTSQEHTIMSIGNIFEGSEWRRIDPTSQEHGNIMSIGDRIHNAQMNDINPARRWIDSEALEEAMFMMAVRESLHYDPMQQVIDDFYDPQFVPNPAPPEDVAALSTATVAELGYTCSICLEDMLIGDKHHVLPCGHVMHYACTTEWFKSGTRCPACNLSPFGLKEQHDRES